MGSQIRSLTAPFFWIMEGQQNRKLHPSNTAVGGTRFTAFYQAPLRKSVSNCTDNYVYIRARMTELCTSCESDTGTER